jgi:hypothetical protein
LYLRIGLRESVGTVGAGSLPNSSTTQNRRKTSGGCYGLDDLWGVSVGAWVWEAAGWR